MAYPDEDDMYFIGPEEYDFENEELFVPEENEPKGFTPLVDETSNMINNLVGLQDFKKEIEFLARFTEANKRVPKKSKTKKVFPIHYVFNIESGMGLSTILQLLTKILYKYGLIKGKEMVEYEGSIFDPGEPACVFEKKHNGQWSVDKDYNVVALNLTRQLDSPYFSMERLMYLMWRERGNVVFVLVVEGKSKVFSKNLITRINRKVNCRHITFPPYTDQEFLLIGKNFFKEYGLDMDNTAEAPLINKIQAERQKGFFQNIRTVEKIIEKVRFEKLINYAPDQGLKQIKAIGAADFIPLLEKEELAVDAWKELDRFVGLETVKKRVREIVDNARVRNKMRELGIQDDSICYHMMFTGNPGTGKTTVARLIGKMFKEMGILKKGDVIEVGREGLVARYVGQTAPKVREKVREALGSVLFVDEAYSLYAGGDRQDYGYEAIDTLIKEMEDKREDLVVILAGYTEEMQRVLEMNPGLRERIPYKIEFPDYNAEDLTQIFFNLLGKDYLLSEGVYDRIHELFLTLRENAGNNFANGRLSRNLVERLKIKHSYRICKENTFTREALLTIKPEDVEALYIDEDVVNYIQKPVIGMKRVGFL